MRRYGWRRWSGRGLSRRPARKKKLAKARALGADETINYVENPTYSATVREMTGGKGVDLVFDSIGGSVWDENFKSLRPGGQAGQLRRYGRAPGVTADRPIVHRTGDADGRVDGEPGRLLEGRQPRPPGRYQGHREPDVPAGKRGRGAPCDGGSGRVWEACAGGALTPSQKPQQKRRVTITG